MRNWSTYLVKCSDDSLYCGVTKDFKNRLKMHNKGVASKYTRSRLPVEPAAIRNNLTKKEAYQLEYRIKKSLSEKKIWLLQQWCFEK